MSDASSIVVASAARTPVGSFNGAFANVPAHDLGSIAIREVLGRARVEPAEVDEVILGQILTAAQGQNPARQAAINAGIPNEATAWGLNQLCGSGLRAIAVGMQQIAAGDARIIVAGGQESMSMAPHAQHLRGGTKMGDLKLVDTMIKDGLTDAFYGYHMGNTAENVARQWQLSREAQDVFAVASQNKAEAAQKAGRFKDEIVAVTVKGRKGDTIVDQDEYIRHGATLESVQKLRPAFDKEGTVTAANASGINDGAAAVVLMSEAEASRRGLTRWCASCPGQPPASIRRSWEQADPRLAEGVEEGGLDGRGPRPGGGQRGLRRAGLRRQQGHGLGSGDRQRQWRSDRHRPSRRGVRGPHLQHARPRDAAARRPEGPRHALHRRWHGCRHVRRVDGLVT